MKMKYFYSKISLLLAVILLVLGPGIESVRLQSFLEHTRLSSGFTGNTSTPMILTNENLTFFGIVSVRETDSLIDFRVGIFQKEGPAAGPLLLIFSLLLLVYAAFLLLWHFLFHDFDRRLFHLQLLYRLLAYLHNKDGPKISCYTF